MNKLSLAACFGYVASVLLANVLIVYVGVVSVGFGLQAPAGVYVVGLTLILRDYIHEHYGVGVACALLLVGCILSFSMGASLAVASAVAFLVSELADTAGYSLTRRYGWGVAVPASNVVGAIVDSALFLLLAFGSLDFLSGQILGKLYTTGAFMLYKWWRHRML
jgi:uncharacterized PurR-regulated membrane protein YhhQ (DUF165 family)